MGGGGMTFERLDKFTKFYKEESDCEGRFLALPSEEMKG